MARQIIHFAVFTCVNCLTAVTWSYLSTIDPLAIHSIEAHVIIMVRNVPKWIKCTVNYKKSVFKKKRGIGIPRRKTITSVEIPWDFSPTDMYGSRRRNRLVNKNFQSRALTRIWTHGLWIPNQAS